MKASLQFALSGILTLVLLLTTGAAQQQQSLPTDSGSSQTATPQADKPSQDANQGQTESTPAQSPPMTQEPSSSNTQTPAPAHEPCSSCKGKPEHKPTAHPNAKKSAASKSGKTTQSKAEQSNKAASSKSSAPQAGNSATTPGKVVVRNGGASDESVQISPGLSNEQQLHNRENTEQLLATTDSNLKRLAGRQLTESQQSTLNQIHTYVRQAKSAADAGDMARAHTLAYKAHLLSDELVAR